jgi:hypothetical protein
MHWMTLLYWARRILVHRAAAIRLAVLVAAIGIPGLLPAFAQTPPNRPSPGVAAQIPVEARAAISAIAQRIVGIPASRLPVVRFAPAVETSFQQLSVRPIGFEVASVVVTEPKPDDSKSPLYSVDGALTFATPVGRQVIVSFVIKYANQKGRLLIDSAILHEMVRAHPKARLLVLPGTVADADLKDSRKLAFETTLARAFQHAITKNTKPDALPAKGDYLLLAPIYDWLPNNVAATMWVTSNKDGLDLPPELPELWDFGGWRVFVMRTTLDPNDGQPKYAKIAWVKPAELGGNGEPELLLVYPLPLGNGAVH